MLELEEEYEVSSLIEMPWTAPQYTRDEVDEAGRKLVGHPMPSSGMELSLLIINNWRSSHSFPLNTFQMGLRQRASQVDSACLIAQRIKRLSSIQAKLKRFKNLSLSEMQDIGGCRAIVKSVRQVDALVDLYKKSRLKHKLDDEDDYIRSPKKSGYRGIHLIYKYHSDRKDTYESLKIEMQFRSPLQHAWATAVETVGTFIRQALKSSQGEKDWLRFFALMGTAIALRERTPPVPNTPKQKKELVQELREFANKLEVETRLQAYGAALQAVERPGAHNAHYFLLALDPAAQQVTVTGYKVNELEKASSEYMATERDIAERPGAEAVLVSVESLASLRRAYPNYFLDTKLFIDALRQALS